MLESITTLERDLRNIYDLYAGVLFRINRRLAIVRPTYCSDHTTYRKILNFKYSVGIANQEALKHVVLKRTKFHSINDWSSHEPRIR